MDTTIAELAKLFQIDRSLRREPENVVPMPQLMFGSCGPNCRIWIGSFGQYSFSRQDSDLQMTLKPF